MKKAIGFLFLLVASVGALAQFGTPYCIDTLAINPYINCPPEYEPVCACNDSTYRNSCFAQRQGLILWEGGTCEPFALDFFPNPVYNNMRVTLFLKFQGNADLYIFDQYGQLEYRQYFSDFERQELFFEISSWEQGLYIIAMRFKDQWAFKKMIKMKNF